MESPSQIIEVLDNGGSQGLTVLSITKIRENCILELANQSKFVKYRALENNQLYVPRKVSFIERVSFV